MNRQASAGSASASRTALAGEIAMAKRGLPEAIAARFFSATAGRLASQRTASAVATASRSFARPTCFGNAIS